MSVSFGDRAVGRLVRDCQSYLHPALCFKALCCTPFCCNAPCQRRSPLNFCSHI